MCLFTQILLYFTYVRKNRISSSFISDTFGRVIARASRDSDEVLVAELDLDQRRDWLDLFLFLATRRPDTYDKLSSPVQNKLLIARNETNHARGVGSSRANLDGLATG
jgi:hypothetical protein